MLMDWRNHCYYEYNFIVQFVFSMCGCEYLVDYEQYEWQFDVILKYEIFNDFFCQYILILSFLPPSIAHERPIRKTKINARSVRKDVQVIIQVPQILYQTSYILINNNTGVRYLLDYPTRIVLEFKTVGHNITFNSGDVFTLIYYYSGTYIPYVHAYTVVPSDLVITQPTFAFTLLP